MGSSSLIKNAFLNKLVQLILTAVLMTAVEYIAGMLSLKLFNVRLWDYSEELGNIQGIICPRFSFFWVLLGTFYCFAVHPVIKGLVSSVSGSMAAAFLIGIFYGIFFVDVAASAQLAAKLKKYAADNNIIVRYEQLKAHIRSRAERSNRRYRFFLPFKSEFSLLEHLAELRDSFEIKKHKNKKQGE